MAGKMLNCLKLFFHSQKIGLEPWQERNDFFIVFSKVFLIFHLAKLTFNLDCMYTTYNASSHFLFLLH